MRIAIQDSWPNLEENAEKEFIARFIKACDNINVEGFRVVTSDDIYKCEPDFVLVTHEFSRKLTPFPTIGLQWSPTNFFADDPYRMKSLLSYDGYIPGNDEVRRFIKDNIQGITIDKPVAPFVFLPTTYRTDFQALENNKTPSLCYVGVHWEGGRHSDLFNELEKRKICRFYGPEKSWEHVPQSYGGRIPFDGHSLVETLAKHGIALCLHKKEHVRENTPSMRIFEALSVGNVLICDQIKFAEENLKDVAYFIKPGLSAKGTADQIEQILERIRSDPQTAYERGRAGKEWFDRNWSLEKKLADEIIPFAKRVSESLRPFASKAAKRSQAQNAWTSEFAPPSVVPTCDVIIRTGGRDISTLDRAVQSVLQARSDYFKLSILIVDYKGRSDVADYVGKLSSEGASISYTRSRDTGFRSTALWRGISVCNGDFVSHLDDDDTVFPSHYDQLLDAICKDRECVMAYTGAVRREDDPGIFRTAENFAGPLGIEIEERSELAFLERYNLNRLLRLDNFIQSNAWIARRQPLQDVVREDPELEVGEDVMLYALLAQRGHAAFTGSATAVWHWRSKQADNSMMSVGQTTWEFCAKRITRRLFGTQYTARRSFEEITFTGGALSEGSGWAGPTHQNAVPVSVGQVIEGGAQMHDVLAPRGFYAHEPLGMWTKDSHAQLTLIVDAEDVYKELFIELEMLVAASDDPDRHIQIKIGARDPVRKDIKTWETFTIRLPLPGDLSAPVTIDIFSSEFVTIPTDSRKLGAYLKKVSLVE